MIHKHENFILNPEHYLKLQYRTRESQSHSIKDLPDEEARSLLCRIHRTINGALSETVWADTLNLVMLCSGDEQSSPADADEGEHPCPYRDYRCVLYLNDDYEGGETYFPQHDIELKPSPGTLMWFPETARFRHGVRKVARGEQWTIVSSWTREESKKSWLYKGVNCYAWR